MGVEFFFIYRMSLLSTFYNETHARRKPIFICRKAKPGLLSDESVGALTSVLQSTRVVQTSSWGDTCQSSLCSMRLLSDAWEEGGSEHFATVPSCFMGQTWRFVILVTPQRKIKTANESETLLPTRKNKISPQPQIHSSEFRCCIIFPWGQVQSDERDSEDNLWFQRHKDQITQGFIWVKNKQKRRKCCLVTFYEDLAFIFFLSTPCRLAGGLW